MSCLRPATGRVSFPGILAVLISSDHASAGNAVFSPLVPEHTGGRDPASLAGSVDCGRRVRIPANVNTVPIDREQPELSDASTSRMPLRQCLRQVVPGNRRVRQDCECLEVGFCGHRLRKWTAAFLKAV